MFILLFTILFISLFLSLKVKENVKLLIPTRLEMDNKFIDGRYNKSVLWGQLRNKIKAIDPEFGHSKEQIARKF